MNADEITEKLEYWAANSRSKHDVLIEAANLIKSQQDENADLKQLLASKEKSLKGSMSLNGEATERIETLILKLAESRRREQAAVHDIEKMMMVCEKGSCHFCANGDCTESPYCSPKWRGPQEARKGAGA